MQIVSDRGMDISPEQLAGLEIHLAPLTLTLDGRSYGAAWISSRTSSTACWRPRKVFPSTSQPSPGEFADLYRRLAASDPDILSIHISSGLSGTCGAARAGAAMVPEAKVTIIDSKTLSGAQGWQVEAAARAVKAGWPLARILDLLAGRRGDGHGLHPADDELSDPWRANQPPQRPRGLDVEHQAADRRGKGRRDLRQSRTGPHAEIRRSKLADHVAERYAPGTAMRVQIIDGNNAEGAAILHERMSGLFDCTWLPGSSVAPVLGAHTGPGLVGIVFGPQAAFTWNALIIRLKSFPRITFRRVTKNIRGPHKQETSRGT